MKYDLSKITTIRTPKESYFDFYMGMEDHVLNNCANMALSGLMKNQKKIEACLEAADKRGLLPEGCLKEATVS